MGKQAKQAYREAIRGRYRKANRTGKAHILDEFCAVCGYNRKYAIRLLGHKKSASPLQADSSNGDDQGCVSRVDHSCAGGARRASSASSMALSAVPITSPAQW